MRRQCSVDSHSEMCAVSEKISILLVRARTRSKADHYTGNKVSCRSVHRHVFLPLASQQWGHSLQRNVPNWTWAEWGTARHAWLSQDGWGPHLPPIWIRAERGSHSTACHLLFGTQSCGQEALEMDDYVWSDKDITLSDSSLVQVTDVKAAACAQPDPRRAWTPPWRQSEWPR